MVRNMVAELYSTLSEDMKTRARKKIQSAMEYLMTYGWAILIISVVLVVLFSLGITNPLFFAPKATPGSCEVVRPNGPGTTSSISLKGGACKEIPQYAGVFNGKSSNVVITQLTTPSSLTISLWIQGNNYNDEIPLSLFDNGPGGLSAGVLDIYFQCNNINWNIGDGCANPFSGSTYPNSNWHNLVITDNPTTNLAYLYIDGKLVGSAGYRDPKMSSGSVIIGEYGYGDFWFQGDISNVQIYNSILSSQEINALYLEGISGAPITLESLLGWWPLNGNANDYSGNNNDGTASNVIWSGTWWQSYIAP